jgi:hypothetical protein
MFHLTWESKTLVFVMNGNSFCSFSLKMHLRFFGPISIFSKGKIIHKNSEQKATCGNPQIYTVNITSKPNHGTFIIIKWWYCRTHSPSAPWSMVTNHVEIYILNIQYSTVNPSQPGAQRIVHVPRNTMATSSKMGNQISQIYTGHLPN